MFYIVEEMRSEPTARIARDSAETARRFSTSFTRYAYPVSNDETNDPFER